MQQPSPLVSPVLRDDLPRYPQLLQALRVTGGTVPGPSGYMSSSVLAPSLYIAFVQQLNSSTILPRDREPCFALDMNGYGLAPGYYTNCRLAGSYQSLPVYEIGGAPVASPLAAMVSPPLPSGAGITPAQVIQLATLSPAQISILNNLSPCQLLSLVNALPISQIHTLTSGVITPTQLSTLVSYITPTQLTNLYTQLTTSQVITLTTALNQDQVNTLVQALTPAQIQTAITGLTTAQLTNLAQYPVPTITALVTGLSTPNLATLLSTSPLPTTPVLTLYPQTTTFTSGTNNNVPITGSIVYVPTTGPTTITGMVPLNTGSAQTVTLYNSGSSTLSIPNLSGSSSSSYQSRTSTGATIDIPALSGTTFTYNPTTNKWNDVASSTAGSATSIPDSQSWFVVSKTGTYTAVEGEFVKCDATTGAFTIFLPAVAPSLDGKKICVKKTDASPNAVTIDGNAAEQIDGALTYLLAAQNSSAVVICDGSAWWIEAIRA